MEFLPAFGNIGFTLLAFVAALSIIVAIHEYGHYIVGRWSGIHAEVFSIGFGPVLWSAVDKHGTRWQLAALPFGGYVRFLGDANAASAGADGEAMSEMDAKERRRSMPGAPLWARAATVAAGPIFNFILSIAIFAGVVLVGGRAADDAIVGGLVPVPEDVLVLEQGDLITAIEGQPVAALADVYELGRSLDPQRSLTYDIVRDGDAMQVQAAFPLLPIVGSVAPQSAAIAAGIAEGDVIMSVDGAPIYGFSQLRAAVDASEGAELDLIVWRAGEMLELTLAPRSTDLPTDEGFETRWLIGITGGLIFEPEIRSVGAWEAVTFGAKQTWFIIESSLSGLSHIISGAISTCNLQGPLGIAETSGAAASQGLDNFIWFIAVLSTAVGLLNLFPIPVLDGGHLVFHAYEAVSGKPPSDKVLRLFMTVGLTLLLSLMLFALSNDIFCP
ncbi:RIP metalloprotease RseP [Rhodobacteraceae bacterium N5(2021)]|uniref:Zinc metalloprotease n=1 Tax=Gymnodinialimonas phycosphaerae TaxID=2841589 RepID=A0A975TYG9_9RHOB|nr:RIP metalloprotease RseP [Gymnodinialimonas phycosphaerae]MBY4892305.1 RIP metalloprotease RseP [Gymnodinialimonas phycosphaerae]